ncbi:MAG: hypothetical protein ABR583_07105 [Gaiellaceae bacterium]
MHRIFGLTLVTALVAAFGLSTLASAAPRAGAPSVKFVTPKAGAMTRSKVTFTVKLSNFKINAKAVGMKPAKGQGHIHFQMDGGKFDFPKYSGANGKLAVKLGVDGTYSPAVTPTITYRNLPKGKHTLKVFLAANNHVYGKSASMRFTVR